MSNKKTSASVETLKSDTMAVENERKAEKAVLVTEEAGGADGESVRASLAVPKAAEAAAPLDEATYSVDECAAKSFEAFSVSPDIVRAAFASAKIGTATKAEAVRIIEAFKTMKV